MYKPYTSLYATRTARQGQGQTWHTYTLRMQNIAWCWVNKCTLLYTSNINFEEDSRVKTPFIYPKVLNTSINRHLLSNVLWSAFVAMLNQHRNDVWLSNCECLTLDMLAWWRRKLGHVFWPDLVKTVVPNTGDGRVNKYFPPPSRSDCKKSSKASKEWVKVWCRGTENHV